MILNAFPDLKWLKKQAEEGFNNQKSWNGSTLFSKGWPNVVINVSTRKEFRNNIRGPLSLFTNLEGESTVETGTRRVTIKEDSFFVTNHDQYYTLDIDQHAPVETFNIHFGEYFTDQVLSSLSQSEGGMLENRFRIPEERVEFHNKLYHRDDAVSTLISDIKDQPSIASLLLEEKLYALMEIMLTKERNLLKVQASLPASKMSTLYPK